MSTISLRRTKDKGLIGLPPKTVETCYVELSGEERELYDEMERMAKGVVQEYIRAGSLIRNYSTVLSIVLRLRQICTNLALCPSDVRSLLPSNNIEGITELVKLDALFIYLFILIFSIIHLSAHRFLPARQSASVTVKFHIKTQFNVY